MITEKIVLTNLEIQKMNRILVFYALNIIKDGVEISTRTHCVIYEKGDNISILPPKIQQIINILWEEEVDYTVQDITKPPREAISVIPVSGSGE